MSFIVCKRRPNGTLVAGTPPKVHETFQEASTEAQRLMGDMSNEALSYSVFQEVARAERVACPVRLVDLR